VFEQPQPYLYVAATQARPVGRTLLVRSRLRPDELGPRLRQTIAAVDADVPLSEMRTMRGIIGGSLGNVMFRVGARQAGAMGLIGLVLAVVGVYGVTSYGASQRTREIGIRLALGAHPVDVRQLVLRHGLGLVIAGVGVGLIFSVGLTSALTQYVVIGSAADPVAIGGVTATLVAIALVACYLPARRAMRIDPIVALRHE
jgi:ABC-type antimicrobial peptide transport system permease subunit